jgi:hypothetical protein
MLRWLEADVTGAILPSAAVAAKCATERRMDCELPMDPTVPCAVDAEKTDDAEIYRVVDSPRIESLVSRRQASGKLSMRLSNEVHS